MPLDDLLANRQPDTRPRIVVPVMQPLKNNEDLLEEQRIDADAIVFDRKLPMPIFSLRPDADQGRRSL